MTERIYIHAPAVNCALGDDIAAAMALMRTNRGQATDVPLALIGLKYSRPYYRFPATGSNSAGSDGKKFYTILFNTVAKTLADAGLAQDEIEPLPVFFGSTSNDIPLYEDAYQISSHVLSQTASGCGNIANEIADHFNLKGACYTFTTACTSSANAIISAAAMISQGLFQRALVVGYDPFTNIGFYGFEALKLIAPSPYRPFDKSRAGIIMGEGCGAVILDKTGQGQNDFYFLGGASRCDTHSVTTHDPAGNTMAAVMREALTQARVEPREIDAVKAHATGSYHNDLTEANGLKQVFKNHLPPVTGLKPYIGHTVGASGVVEMILFSEAVKNGFIPATPGFEETDAELDIVPVTRPIPIQRGTFLLNYFGFGGNCVALVISNKA